MSDQAIVVRGQDTRAALEPRNIGEGQTLAEIAAKAKLFGITSKEDAFARMATGMGLGLGAWQSLRGMYVINGKVGMYADLMLALCVAAPECEFFRCIETTAERATFTAKRRDAAHVQTLSFSMDEAKRAGLLSNPTYQKYPANMLRARCVANLARLMFPERMHGIYTKEELEDVDAGAREVPAVVQAEPVPLFDPATFALEKERIRVELLDAAHERDRVRCKTLLAELFDWCKANGVPRAEHDEARAALVKMIEDASREVTPPEPPDDAERLRAIDEGRA